MIDPPRRCPLTILAAADEDVIVSVLPTSEINDVSIVTRNVVPRSSPTELP